MYVVAAVNPFVSMISTHIRYWIEPEEMVAQPLKMGFNANDSPFEIIWRISVEQFQFTFKKFELEIIFDLHRKLIPNCIDKMSFSCQSILNPFQQRLLRAVFLPYSATLMSFGYFTLSVC